MKSDIETTINNKKPSNTNIQQGGNNKLHSKIENNIKLLQLKLTKKKLKNK